MRLVMVGLCVVAASASAQICPKLESVRDLSVEAAPLTISVTGPDGKPVANAHIEVQSALTSRNPLTADTDGNGVAEIPVAIDAQIVLSCVPKAGFILVRGPRAGVVLGRFGANQRTVELAFEPARTLRVAIVDEAGKPMPSARLELLANLSDGPAVFLKEGRTNAAGAFVADLLPRGAVIRQSERHRLLPGVRARRRGRGSAHAAPQSHHSRPPARSFRSACRRHRRDVRRPSARQRRHYEGRRLVHPRRPHPWRLLRAAGRGARALAVRRSDAEADGSEHGRFLEAAAGDDLRPRGRRTGTSGG